MVMFLTWLGSSAIAPRLLARRNLRLGNIALEQRRFSSARYHLERAARYEPLREEAVCLLAEACLLDKRPADALFALNTLLMEQEQLDSPQRRSARVRLLRGVAGCMLGRASAARRELAAISRAEASVDELLAAAQACVMSSDPAGAQLLLDKLDAHMLGDEVGARVKLCRSAMYFRLGAWEKAGESLPEESACAPEDARICAQIKGVLHAKLANR